MSNFVMCIHNDGNPASLIVGQIYRVLPSAAGDASGMIRVRDEDASEPDGYLYPQEMFIPVDSLENAVEMWMAERAKRGSREKYEALLAKVPDVEPEEFDKLENRSNQAITEALNRVYDADADSLLDEYDFGEAERGPVVPPSPNKTRITIRIDTDILNWFRETVNANGGGSYQALMNQALRDYIENQDDNWETTLRRIVREELQLAKAGE